MSFRSLRSLVKQRVAPTERRALSAIVAATLAMTLTFDAAVSLAQDEGVASRPAGEHAGEAPLGAYLAGVFAQQQRDYDNAADLMARALSADPDNPELIANAMVLMAMEGRFERAIELAERIEPGGQGYAVATLIRAVGAMRDEHYAESIEHLDRLPKGEIIGIMAPLQRAWAHFGTYDLDGAIAELDSLASAPGPAQLADFHRALIYDVAGRSADAKAAFDSAIERQDHSSARLALFAGNFFEREGDLEGARQLYQSVLSNGLSNEAIEQQLSRLDEGTVPQPMVTTPVQGFATALFDVASALPERAQQLVLVYANAALALDPSMESGHMLIGEVLERQERPKSAISAYRAVPPDSPYSWAARLRIAEQLDILERTDEAIGELKALAAEQPDRFEPWYRIGNLRRQQERFELAAEAYTEAITRAGQPQRFHWSLYYFRGISYERMKQWPDAEADFLTALELEPDQPFVLNYLAYSWVEQKTNLGQAEEMLIKAVDRRPRDGYIVDSLGWVYYRLERFDEAVAYLERAIELRPQDPTINDHLGDAYWRVGRTREARIQWSRALSLEPEEDEVPKIERKLREGLPPLGREQSDTDRSEAEVQ